MEKLRDCWPNFYLHIAKLFYAVSFIDGKIRGEEYDSLKNTLKREWLQKRSGKKEVVEEVVRCFDTLKKGNEKAIDCFQEFVIYMNEHEKLFTNQMKNVLWEVSCSIADSVNKKNKSELILLARLGRHLGLMK